MRRTAREWLLDGHFVPDLTPEHWWMERGWRSIALIGVARDETLASEVLTHLAHQYTLPYIRHIPGHS